MTIKNAVFDIGNVLIRLEPIDIITNIFSDKSNLKDLIKKAFESSIWTDLNLGKITEYEAVEFYSKQLNINKKQSKILIDNMNIYLMPIDDSVKLINELYNLNIKLYSITNNKIEIVSFLKNKYSFFKQFIDIIVSEELGILKPSEMIYYHLINKHSLIPEETVFIDDSLLNAEGAKRVRMKSIHFIDTISCRNKLKDLGVMLS